MATKSLVAKSYSQHLAGDRSVGLTIAANASLLCAPVDLVDVNIAAATIILERVSGSGTLKASAEISADGLTTWLPLGDIITAVTTAPKAFKLSDAAFIFGRFLRVTVTETGGANSAVARCVFTGQGK